MNFRNILHILQVFKGEKGQKRFNYLYSIGASIVILGALFKLTHVPGADLMLIIGMGTEAVIFFLSAFDTPARDYKWEKVYPELDIPNKEEAARERLDRMKDGTTESRRRSSETNTGSGTGGNVTIIGGGMPAGGTIVVGGGSPVAGGTTVIGSNPAAVGTTAPLVASGNVGVTPEQADQVTEATEKYVKQLNEISVALSKLQETMAALDTTTSYAEQMATLNRNIQGLNTIYEIQLKSVSSQLGTIEMVNQGLNNIRALYENGQNDSFRIRQETDQMTRNLQQLNEVYARMLQAMTVGYGLQAQQPMQQPTMPYQPQQPQQPLYGQQPSQPNYNPQR
ncbi:MAG: gliding motility protein GldL [Bacteroidales bacterium]|nr:gliding motility protein GldL [Bacteroidales bacterium]